jgi:hypothetical protein
MARRLPFATTQREYLPSQLSNGMPPSSTLLVWRLAIFAVLIWPIIIFSLYSGHPQTHTWCSASSVLGESSQGGFRVEGV